MSDKAMTESPEVQFYRWVERLATRPDEARQQVTNDRFWSDVTKLAVALREAVARIEELERPARECDECGQALPHVWTPTCDALIAARQKAKNRTSAYGEEMALKIEEFNERKKAYSAVPPCDCGADLGHDHDRCSYQRYVDARKGQPE